MTIKIDYVNRRRAERLVKQFIAIPGKWAEEQFVADAIAACLRAAGLSPAAIQHDTANRKSQHGGQCGNLIVKLPGTPGQTRQPRRMLMAHMDTVPLAAGCKPVRRGNRIVPAGKTALGADNRAGTATLLTTLLEILDRKLPHPPLTFLWTVQEETGLLGARHVSLGKLAKPAMAFNFDGGVPGDLTIGATGAYRMTIRIHGIAAHAGVHPEQGVSATAIAAIAIADLHANGWHGLINKNGHLGTSNIGVIEGGHATNVVTDEVFIRAEIRSHKSGLRDRALRAYRKAFESATRSIKNSAKQTGNVEIESTLDYDAFLMSTDSPVIEITHRICNQLGLPTQYRVANGGLDANWINAHGIPTVTLGCGQHNIHTIREYLDLDEYHDACRLALRLATDV